MYRPIPKLSIKSILVALSLVTMISVGCGGDGGPAESVAGQTEIEKFLAENPEADVDLVMEGEDE